MYRCGLWLSALCVAGCFAQGEPRQRSLYGSGSQPVPLGSTGEGTSGDMPTTSISAGHTPSTSSDTADRDDATTGELDGGSSTSEGEDTETVVADAFPVGESRWIGAYQCSSQGQTSLELTLTYVPGADLQGVFAFGPHATNPDVPAGSFEVSGTFEPTDGTLVLTGGPWIVRPDETWITVGLEGTYDAKADGISGTVESCSSFTVVRQD